ncbi:MAG: hypothetical protein J0M11_15080 [Anaerolineae bacterium]|nr:hypothetical protein [Anaerolineae bacterium]
MIAATINPSTRPIKRPVRPVTRSNGLNRVFAAAVVNRQFCDLLLKNPQEALQKGYLGETFTLTPEENALIASIQANTLSDLAKQVYGSISGAD